MFPFSSGYYVLVDESVLAIQDATEIGREESSGQPKSVNLFTIAVDGYFQEVARNGLIAHPRVNPLATPRKPNPTACGLRPIHATCQRAFRSSLKSWRGSLRPALSVSKSLQPDSVGAPYRSPTLRGRRAEQELGAPGMIPYPSNRSHGPVTASVWPLPWILKNRVSPEGEKQAPANSEPV